MIQADPNVSQVDPRCRLNTVLPGFIKTCACLQKAGVMPNAAVPLLSILYLEKEGGDHGNKKI